MPARRRVQLRGQAHHGMAGLSTFEAFKHLRARDDMVELVGEKLLALQEVLFDMLVEITDYFDEKGIEYTLSGGTCLGSVRHQGFVPWDDDVDLNVPRSSYERIRETFDECLGDRYWLHTPEDTPGYGLGLARIRKKGTVVRSRDDFETDECGACVDLFILENVPDNVVVRSLHGAVSLGLGFGLSCRRFARYGDRYLAMVEGDASTARVFKVKKGLGRLASVCSIDAWCRLWNAWNSLCCDERSRYLSIPAGRKHYFGELYARSDFFPVKMGVFEGRQFKLPANPDAYLHAIHGDYWSIPSEQDRETHAVFEFDLGA